MIRTRYPNHVHFGVKFRGYYHIGRTGLILINLHTKFVVSIFTRYEDTSSDAKCRQEPLLYNIGPTRYVSKM